MTESPPYIAFYGTLLEDSPHFRRLNLGRYLTFEGPCEIKGDLYDIEAPATNENYPALIEGKGTVKGQMFSILDDAFFPEMDAYEAFPETLENSHYGRRLIMLQKPHIEAWVYIYKQSIAGRHKIDSGDWVEYLKAKTASR